MQINEIEELVKNLKGVLNCRITHDNTDEIKEIHIVADETRSPKQVSRDVQSVFQATFNIPLDYKKISIAQIRDSVNSINSRSGLKLSSFEKKVSGGNCLVKVVLTDGQDIYVGENTGMNNFSTTLRKTAEATLFAIESMIGETGVLALNDAKVIDISVKQAVVVDVTAFTQERAVEFCGCSVVYDDKYESAVKAVLSATSPLVERFIVE